MGRYTVIADTGEKLIDLLQKTLVPDIIQNENGIGLRSPEDHADVSLGLFLYDITESEEVKAQMPAAIRRGKISKPPIYLSLYYMVTAYARGDSRYRLSQEEKILGRVIQTFLDNPVISYDEERRQAENKKTAGDIPAIEPRILLQRLSMEEKNRIWNFPNMGYRLSLFYKVSPVAIYSAVLDDFGIVREAEFNVNDKRTTSAISNAHGCT